MKEFEPGVLNINTSKAFASLMVLATLEADHREGINTKQTIEKVKNIIFPSVNLQEKS